MNRITPLLAVLLFTVGLHADTPTLQFSADGVALTGAKPGNRISWVGMVREFDGTLPVLRIVRGLEPFTGARELSLGNGFDPSCSVWAVGGIDEPMTVVRSGDRCAISDEAIDASAAAGATQFIVRSSIVFGHYIGRKHSAWRFGVRDGSDLDADGQINGEIVIALSTMQKLKGSPHPPDVISAGDTLLLLDSDQMRVSVLEVAQ